MKLELLVIADQRAAVNVPGPVHTARHTMGVGSTLAKAKIFDHGIAHDCGEQNKMKIGGGITSFLRMNKVFYNFILNI